MFLLIYVIIGLLWLYMVLFLRSEKKLSGRALPGPRGLPLIGSILELTPSNVFFKWSAYVQQYGHIYRIKILGDDMVILNSAEVIRKAFGSEPYNKLMNDRARTFYGDVVYFGSSSTAFYPHGNDPIHSGMRKGFTKAFHIFGDGRKEFESTIQMELGRLVEEIESNNGRPFEFQRLCRRFIENVMAVLLRGYPIRNEEEFTVFNDYSSETDWLLNPVVDALLKGLPFLIYLPTKFRYHYRAVENSKTILTRTLIEEAKATYKAGQIRGYLDFMIRENLQSRQEQTPEDEMVFNDTRILVSALEAISAGQNTSLAHLSSLFLLIINHPRYQEKMAAEIDAVIGRERLPRLEDKARYPLVKAVVMEAHRYIPTLPELLPHNTSLAHLSSLFLLIINHPRYQEKMAAEIDAVIGRERLPRLEDKAQCPLVEAVVMEAHRYIPTLPGLLPHVCRTDTELEGYHIAKGTTVVANTFHVHHDEKVWGDPWTFRPERFLDDNGQLIPHDHPLRKSWLPFGTGRRMCIGESLARSRGFLFITTLLQRWNFRLPPGVHISSDPRDGEIVFNLQTAPKTFACCAVPRL